MQSFQQWCRAKGLNPKTAGQITQAVVEYLQSRQTTWAWLRQNRGDLQQLVSAKVDPAFQAVINAPDQNTKRARLTQLQEAIKSFCARVMISGALALTADVNRAVIHAGPKTATDSITPPFDFMKVIWKEETRNRLNFEVGLVKSYVEMLIEAIDKYADEAVPHSREVHRLRELVKGQLKAFLTSHILNDPNRTMIVSYIFDQPVPGATGATTVNAICDFWSSQRTFTRERKQAVEVWKAGGRNYDKVNLRRFGSAAEAEDVTAKKGFYQAPRGVGATGKGGSFERYKWFLDLSIEGATTSVPTQNQKSFDIYLCSGVVGTLQGLKKEYDKKDQPAVMHKPNIGGETGCFGVHEDVLPEFNQLISRIVVKDQQQKGKTQNDIKK